MLLPNNEIHYYSLNEVHVYHESTLYSIDIKLYNHTIIINFDYMPSTIFQAQRIIISSTRRR